MNRMTKLTGLLCILFFSSTYAGFAQEEDSTGLPGDHFSLAGALEIFSKSTSVEDFEQRINTQDNGVNNLDLNEDGETDYIQVVSKKEGMVQVLILRVLVSEEERQDIAVIEIEQTGPESAVAQITGDEDIFGEEIMLEAGEENPNDNEARSGPSLEQIPVGLSYYDGLVVNVWAWPSVRFIYAPGYRLWASPYSWRVRPTWWRPWRPLGWATFRPMRYRYYPRYKVVTVRRVVAAPRIYRPARVSSVTVVNRNRVAVNNYRAKRTVKTTTVTGPRGRQYQKRTTTVEGPRGKVKHQKTTVHRKR